MNFLQNRSLKFKCLGGILILFIILLLSGCLSILTLYRINASFERLAAGNSVGNGIELREIQHLQWISDLSNYLLNDKAKEIPVQTDPTKCGLGQWYGSDERRMAEEAFPTLKQVLIALDDPHKRLHQSAVSIDKLRRDGNHDKAHAVYREQTLPALQEVRAKFSEVRAALGKELTSLNEAYHKERAAAYRTTGILAALGLFATLSLALLFLRSILRPIETISTFSRNCLESNEQCAIAIDSKDELGTLATNLISLVDHLNKQLAFSEGILRGISVPCSVFSPTDTTVFTNQPMVDLLERDGAPDSFAGMTSGEYIWGDKNKPTISTHALRERALKTADREFTTFKGKLRHARISSAPFYDRHNEVLGTLSIWIDMTEVVAKQQAIEANAQRLDDIAVSAQSVADGVASASHEISAQMGQAGAGAKMQRDRVAQTAYSMSQMNDTVLEVSRNAARASEVTADARVKAQEGSSLVSEVMQGIAAAEEHARSLKDGMSELGKQSDGIGEIINVINEIADQTNLLALNAAIEAARAGDAGRGFAVVADEVRKLAEKTMLATREVSQVISGIQKGTRANIQSVERAADAINEATKLATASGQSLAAIVSLAAAAADQAHAIAAAAGQQSSTSLEISHALDSVNSISAETSAALADVATACGDLARQAAILHELIRKLRG